MSTVASDKHVVVPRGPLALAGLVALAACIVAVIVGGAAAPAATGL